MEVKQVSNWFINARKRLWQPELLVRGEDVRSHLSNGKGRLVNDESDIGDSENDDSEERQCDVLLKKVRFEWEGRTGWSVDEHILGPWNVFIFSLSLRL